VLEGVACEHREAELAAVAPPLDHGSGEDLAPVGPAPTATFLMRGTEIRLVGLDEAESRRPGSGPSTARSSWSSSQAVLSLPSPTSRWSWRAGMLCSWWATKKTASSQLRSGTRVSCSAVSAIATRGAASG